MAFMLKSGQEAFEIVDGPYAGKNYKKDVSYDTIPETEAHRFEAIQLVLPLAKKLESEPAPDALAPNPEPDTQARKKRSDINA